MNVSLSAYLNLLRMLAALAVYLDHGQNFTKYRIPYVGNMGSEAVFVFFVLSGMLITFSGVKQSDSVAFLRARLVRLWSVCLPALALTMATDTLGQYISLTAYSPMQPYNLFKWTASVGLNALFLNQIWSLDVFAGTNGPFWSLSYEFWYYMIFAAALYFNGRKRLIVLASAALIAGPAILIGLPIWLMGSAVHFAILRYRVSAVVGWALWLGTFAAALAFTAFDAGPALVNAFPTVAASAKWKVDFWPESYLIGALVALNIYGFSLIADKFGGLLRAAHWPIKTGADISFGLYLFHYPLMYFVKAAMFGSGVTSGTAFVGIVYTVPFLIAAPLALYCETRKNLVSKLVDFIFSLALKLRRGIISMPLNDPLVDSTATKLYDGQA